MGSTNRIRSRTSQRQAARRRNTWLVVGGGVLVVMAFVAFLYFSRTPTSTTATLTLSAPLTLTASIASGTSSPSLVEESPVDTGRNHLDAGQPTPIYSTDPPTSGDHDPVEAPVGFYDESPGDAHLVHSMEHGDVIIWYDCTKAPDGDCETLKAGIKELILAMGSNHLIAAPRSMPTVLALTSWGKLQRFDAFDVEGMRAFILRNINNGPEKLDNMRPPG